MAEWERFPLFFLRCVGFFVPSFYWAAWRQSCADQQLLQDIRTLRPKHAWALVVMLRCFEGISTCVVLLGMLAGCLLTSWAFPHFPWMCVFNALPLAFFAARWIGPFEHRNRAEVQALVHAAKVR